jgi:hypothetical protein
MSLVHVSKSQAKSCVTAGAERADGREEEGAADALFSLGSFFFLLGSSSAILVGHFAQSYMRSAILVV